jgi:hypothetical protein
MALSGDLVFMTAGTQIRHDGERWRDPARVEQCRAIRGGNLISTDTALRLPNNYPQMERHNQEPYERGGAFRRDDFFISCPNGVL